MRRLFAITLFLSPVLLAPGCDTASDICALVCECEHCSDILEFYRCEQIDASQEIADVYDCGGEWDEYASCYQDEGTCDDDEARFSTRKPGSCSSSTDTGFPCTGDTECAGIGSSQSTCVNLTCQYKSCAGGNDNPCSSASDCPTGEDKCETELEKLQECLMDASENDNYLGVDFD